MARRSKMVVATLAAALVATLGTASVSAAPEVAKNPVKMARDTGSWCC